jgi:glycosyltransferase involved in cell wall biosynthesis
MTDKTVVQMLDFVPHARRSLETVLLSLAERLRAHGWRTIHVFAGEPAEYFRDRLRELDSPYLVAKFQPTLRSAISLGRELRRYHPDVLQTKFMSKFSLALPALKLAARARFLVFSDNSSGFAAKKSFLGRLLVRMRGAFAGLYIDRLVAVSEFVRRRDVNEMYLPAHKARVIYNGVDVQKYAPESCAPHAEPVVAFVGRLEPGKGIHTLLRAAKELGNSSDFPLKVLIAGRGAQEQELKSFCAESDLDRRITFLGQIDWLPRLFSTATVVVVPSEYGEAFGWVVVEAMACGACLLVSDDGAIPEVVGPDGKAGLVFRAGDVADLAAKLRELLADPERRTRMREAARLRAVDQFSLARMLEEYEALYGELDHELRTKRQDRLASPPATFRDPHRAG